MQGIFIKGQRPKSKKEVKDALAAEGSHVYIEATSLFGNAYDGMAADMPVGTRVSFVGPDPYKSRKFYGTLQRTATGFRCT